MIEKRTIVIPFLPPSLNDYSRYNRWQNHKCHSEWKLAVWAKCNESGNRVPRPCRKVKLKADLYFSFKRKRDETNYSATLWKLFLDGIVVAGIIPDDTAEYVEVSGKIGMFETDKNPCSIIYMECYLS